jgi:hypothetical protein
MTKGKKILGVVLVTSTVAITLTLFVFRDKPTLLSLNGTVDWEDEHADDILNPFRSRAPERAAELLLHRYEDGQCEGVAQSFGLSNDPRCPEEKKYPIISFSLRARTDVSVTETMLLYYVKRDFGQQGTATDPFWFHVIKQPDGSWKVVQSDRWY